ncbi:hypothetical protein QEZ40_002568 [Streptomyces katrae]|uniref:Uncharacterized protein n=1 Tax=Streptomyces katrae TaxID=68223 RepID=A0ABT7GWF6_9ACTN|nr:hypothetical protein [Streptomyces katrae]MDK9497626.1 hypothetical protein [Streptomyces katrae]
MTDHGIALPAYRLHVVPAVVALASPTWQREVWLDPDRFEGLDYTVRVLFDDFCDADDPLPWLGQSLRSEEEVELMARLGAAYGAVQDAVGAAARDEVYPDSPGWSVVVAAAARLAQVLVANDQLALSRSYDAGRGGATGAVAAEAVVPGTDDRPAAP